VNPLPPITKYLLWAIGIGFVLQQLAEGPAITWFALWPWAEVPIGNGEVHRMFQPWQLVTHALLHGNFIHLFVNAIGLFQFGGRIEYALGRKRFITFALVCTVGAGLTQLLVSTAMVDSGSQPFPTVGISGFIYGLLLAYGLMYPHERVMLVLPPVEMSARTMAIAFGALSLFMGVTGTAGGVAHFAHLGGMLAGWLLLRTWQGKPPFGGRKPPKRPNLRSVN
jgi:membrane associated rhomboid family serine protease